MFCYWVDIVWSPAGIIVQRYTSGQTINVVVEITAHHFGFFQFKICPNEDFSLDKGQDCFDRFSVGHLDNLQNLKN